MILKGDRKMIATVTCNLCLTTVLLSFLINQHSRHIIGISDGIGSRKAAVASAAVETTARGSHCSIDVQQSTGKLLTTTSIRSSTLDFAYPRMRTFVEVQVR